MAHFEHIPVNEPLAPPLGVGLIGTGSIGREHISNLALLPEFKLVAVSDTSDISLERADVLLKKNFTHDVQIYKQFSDLINDSNVECIIVATPNFHHIQVLREAIPSQKHIMCEKPLCTTREDCNEVLGLLKNHKGVFWVGMEYRYIPPVARLVSACHTGIIGKQVMLNIREHRFPFLKKIDDWNRFNRYTGGTLVEKCCHFFDLMRLIMQDEPTRIYASGSQDVCYKSEQYNSETPDILDNAFVIVDFQKGGRACLDLNMFAEASKYQEEISIVGPKGKIEAFAQAHGDKTSHNTPNYRVGIRGDIIYSEDVTHKCPEPVKVEEFCVKLDEKLLQVGDHGGATFYELQKFATSIRESKEPEVSAIDGVQAVLMGLAAQQSIETKLPVDMANLQSHV